jgi:GT2 family glycosyltransferase
MSGAPVLSIVIPTFNGGPVLRRTVENLLGQEAPADGFEIIIVDDGSTDGSTDGLPRMDTPVRLRVLRQGNEGRAAARNRGAAAAEGRALLFLDADIWAAPGLVAAHLAHHAHRRDIGVQGTWREHPDTLTTMFMRARNVIPDLTVRRREGMSPYHVVTRNFSIDANAFRRAGGFDEGFRGYGWEDIELAFRLVRAAVALRYEPAAMGWHYHVQTLEALRDKLREAGEGAVYFWRKHGRDRQLGLFLEILPVLLPLKWLVYRSGVITALVRPLLPGCERLGLTLLCGELYNHLLWQAYYQGVFAALRPPS